MCFNLWNAIPFNGQPENIFKPSRGIRQVDPLSPYLFILVRELLSLLIQRQVSLQNWSPIPIATTGPFISHTLFKNDVFLFVEASLLNAQTIHSVITDFASHIGLHINLLKSKIYFSDNCDPNLYSDISSILCINQTSNLDNYLLGPKLHEVEPPPS